MGAVDEAMAARLVEEADMHLAFRHSLVHESIYAHLPLALRTGLHRQVARALAAAGAPSGQIASPIWSEVRRPTTPEGVDWLERAARGHRPACPRDCCRLAGSRFGAGRAV